MTRKVLVVGATGKQGGAVIDELLASKKVAPRALTRSPESASATALAGKGVDVVKGSFGDPNSLLKALSGVSSAFLVTEAVAEGAAGEVKQGKVFVDVAKEAKLPHLVYTSVEGAERKTGVPHFESKFEIEEYIRASGISHTILRPVAFYENFPPRSGLQSFFGFGLFNAALWGKKLQLVSVKDIGWFAARALEDPDKYKGRIIKLAGDELSVPELQDKYAAVQGFRPWRAHLPPIALRMLPYDMRMMFGWFYTGGYQADIPALRKEHPGLLNFEQWLRESQA
ncbi:hypothetical protein PLICRDRAFT_115222 [Plicaturopsis crispa FD-325 SS-3]|nr:hypothetical protein PLICRDRAFT_115222 [Plicaturopsis crispa FD-325 SS-3]